MKKEIDTNKFEVGERVEAKWFGEWLKGTVINHDPLRDILEYRVLLDTIGAHCFSGRIMRHVQNTKQQSKIVITTDGTTTTATHYDGKQNVKSASAKCAPDDMFNFTTGAQLAFNRLVYGTDYNPADVAFKQNEDKSTPAPAVRLWCAKDCKCGKRGHIYEQVGNQIKLEYDYHSHTRTYEEFCSWNESVAPYFFPLLHRPAKEGEYTRNKITGEICKVIALDKDADSKGYVYVRSAIPHLSMTGCYADRNINQPFNYYAPDDYDVISGYHSEYETCPMCGKTGEK